MRNDTYQQDLFTPAGRAPLPVWRAVIGTLTVNYTLKRSERAKCIRLQIGIATGLEVVVPKKTGMRELERFMAKKARWIQKNLPSSAASSGVVRRRRLRDGSAVVFLGRPRVLRVTRRPGPPRVRLSGREIEVWVGPGSGEDGLREALMRWYFDAARRIIGKRVEALSGGRAQKVSIGDQKTLWGSCSPGGSLSFNWRLVMAPPRVIDYLVVHELVHMKHPDHSRRFWAAVERRCPDFARHEEWLKKSGPGLTV